MPIPCMPALFPGILARVVLLAISAARMRSPGCFIMVHWHSLFETMPVSQVWVPCENHNPLGAVFLHVSQVQGKLTLIVLTGAGPGMDCAPPQLREDFAKCQDTYHDAERTIFCYNTWYVTTRWPGCCGPSERVKVCGRAEQGYEKAALRIVSENQGDRL